MSELILNFRCHVGTYEIRRLDQILDDVDLGTERPDPPPNSPYLVHTAPELNPWTTLETIAPGTRVLDQAIRTLLAVRLPEMAFFDTPNEADELLSKLGKHVLAISRRIGMLHWGSDNESFGAVYESLEDWAQLAANIQQMFSTSDDCEFDVGLLHVLLSSKSGNATIQIRPKTTGDALMYRVAQMIAGGTTQQACENCGASFLGGGAGRDSSKKRSDARFCSDKCRSNYHNEARRKATRKSRL